MKERVNQVGFSQRIRLEWLRYTADLFLAGKEKDTIYKELQSMLKEQSPVDRDVKRGSREKRITILMKIWSIVPPGLEGFRDAGLEFLKTLPQGSTLPVHWGMSMAVYPFFGVVAASVGRLLRLQGSFSISQVQRRLTPISALRSCDEVLQRWPNSAEAAEAKIMIVNLLEHGRLPNDIKETRKSQGKYIGEE